MGCAGRPKCWVLTVAWVGLCLLGPGCAQPAPQRETDRNPPSPRVASLPPAQPDDTEEPPEVDQTSFAELKASRPALVPVSAAPAALGGLRNVQEGEQPLPPPRKAEKEEPLTLHFDDLEVRKALETLSREAKMNILVSPGVVGRVTANLKDVTPDQALQAIVRLAGLEVRREGGVVYVYTPEELIRLQGHDPRLRLRVYRLSYIRAGDVERMIRPLLSTAGKISTSPPSEVGIGSSIQQTGGAAGGAAGGGAGGGAMPGADATPGGGGGAGPGGGAGGGLSTGGNSLAGGEILVVQDQEPILQEIDQVLAQLDIQPLQVLIEAVIMRLTLNKSNEFGVNFAVVDTARRVLTVSGNGALLNATAAFDPLRVLTAEGLVRGGAGSGFAADEPGLKFGFVTQNATGFMRALERLGKLEVLATPRLLVLNKQRAQLQLGQRLGFATFSQSLVSTVQQIQFLNVGTQLRVRPFISTDGMIRMEINPERSTGQIVNGIPQTDVAEVATNVMVPDGSTLVIGGLIEDTNDRRQSGTPILASLPWIGALFRERQQLSTKNELIVLLTPRIWDAHGQGAHPPSFVARPTPVPAPAPLMAVQVRPPAAPVYAGQDVDLEILVDNRGPVPAHGVTVTAECTPGLLPIVSEGHATAYRVDGNRVTFQLLSVMEPQTRGTYHVLARAVQPGEQLLRAQAHTTSLADPARSEAVVQVLPPQESSP